MFGVELGFTELESARVGLVRHAPGLEVPRHGHDRACVHVVLRGLYVEPSRAGTAVACPGDVVVKGPGLEHCNRFGPYGAESLRFELPDSDSVARLVRALDAEGLEWAFRLGRTLREVRTLPSRPGASPQFRMLMRLKRDFRGDVSLARLSSELGVHRSHATRQFTREFGCSPRTYVSWKRTAWAAQELSKGGFSLAAIAADARFADQSHCSRVFKRSLGVTPARWSRAVRW